IHCLNVISLLLSACGRAVKNSRIIEGQDATPGSWPWHAIVVTYGPYGYDQCGGSLITNQWVLTSAQCLPSRYAYHQQTALSTMGPAAGSPVLVMIIVSYKILIYLLM
uniref:Peptidase S1 domain-containing protein n=1 Tax=Astatotilapia calliptera TaxID=8154 RepID=A0A3P8QLL7_ASTCA